MRTVLAVLLCAGISGCGITESSTDQWSNWESNEKMLPSGFPFPTKDEVREEGPNRFWTIDYDLDGDTQPDVRVWYLIKKSEQTGPNGKEKMTIIRNPHKVEKLKLGFFAVYSKIDFQLTGQAEQIQKHEDGETVSTWVR